MREYDDAVLECFLDKQLQLFPEPVARLWMKQKIFWKSAWRRGRFRG